MIVLKIVLSDNQVWNESWFDKNFEKISEIWVRGKRMVGNMSNSVSGFYQTSIATAYNTPYPGVMNWKKKHCTLKL